MSMRGLSGWQTALADLSLILFAVVAAAYRDDPTEAERADQAAEISLGQPMAVFRPGGDADLTRWLGSQDLGQGEVATVVVRHRPGAAAAATREAANLVAQIEAAGYPARLMVEPSPQPEVLVVIAFDQRGGTEIQDGTEIAVTR
ncbi:MAG: hypothetical protein CL803_04630 [Citromicrobium sp.]|nr:hypothetical protein [Citromicrobium sp.]MAO95654.1 hypothetical protein [Citromicrobium sp.]MAS86275.1 hypothetical protein [Erythrobacteraceae bacterium]MBT47440.1 hypothetical protein [Citromicrobium sp.]